MTGFDGFHETRSIRLGDAPTEAALNNIRDTDSDDEETIQAGAQMLRDAFDEDAVVELSSLTWGDRNRIQDEGLGRAARETFALAAGLERAPFLEDTDPDDTDAVVGVLTDAPPQIADWLLAEFAIANEQGNGD